MVNTKMLPAFADSEVLEKVWIVDLGMQIRITVIGCLDERANKIAGIDLDEYYPSVEWDILKVPALRHKKK